MKIEKILAEINECIQNYDLTSLDKNLDLFLKDTSDEFACQQLAQILGNNYTQYKSDGLAKVLENIIKKRKSLALINHPFNYLFQTIVSTGSIEMYECFIEEAAIPFLSNVDPEEHELYYMELLGTAQELTDKLFNDNKKCIKGKHYNGAFSKLEENENIVLINEQDYIIIEDVVERYNTIVGRRDIIKDLNNRGGLDL
jgi:hypothetical protein